MSEPKMVAQPQGLQVWAVMLDGVGYVRCVDEASAKAILHFVETTRADAELGKSLRSGVATLFRLLNEQAKVGP